MLIGHGGNIRQAALVAGCDPGEIRDMSSNINPMGPMPELMAHLASCLDAVAALPEADAGGIVRRFAEQCGLCADQVLAGGGTTQFIHLLPLALKPKQALVLGPTYADYADACAVHGVDHDFLFAAPREGFEPPMDRLCKMAGDFDLVFICNPNNPTGQLIPAHELKTLCAAHPKTVFVVDESYLGFAPADKAASLITDPPANAVVLHSYSKLFAVPGLRIGFMIADTDRIQKLLPHIPPWSVNSLAQCAARFLLDNPDKVRRFVDRSRQWLAAERTWFSEALSSYANLTLYPSWTSFFLGALPRGVLAADMQRKMLAHKILIRDCSNFKGLDASYLRISLKTREDNYRVVSLLNRSYRDDR